MTSAIPGFRRMADSARPPFGTATLPGLDAGADLTGRDYVEEEFLAEGDASAWAITERPGEPTPLGDPRRFVTRVLVRRPRDPERASGTAHLEPLHPMQEEALTWSAAGAAFTRAGDAWVGVSVYAHMAQFLREIDPVRYADIDIPVPGLEWDIFGGVARALRAGAVPGLRVERALLSGWSATGTFVRLFLREGFDRRHEGAIDGGAIFISSGGAGDAGYPALSPDTPAPALDDPRRTVRDIGIPVIEVLTECESETHEHQVRDDSDAPGDPYRLYQVAGTGHIEAWSKGRLANDTQLAEVDRSIPRVPIVERDSDSRLDLVARAILTRLDDWVAGRRVPPTQPRFGYDGPQLDDGGRGLARDADGNALGGVRTPWIEAPLGRYFPHGTVAPDAPALPSWMPFADPARGAWLRAITDPFPRERVLERFGSEEEYVAAFTAATRSLADAGLLLDADVPELLASAPERWAQATA